MTDAPADLWLRYDADVCELVLAEALNNIVEHGHISQGDPVGVTWCDTGRLQITIIDHGRPCPLSVIDNASLPNPDDVAEGGYGWAIISMLCHNLTYRSEQGENILAFSIQPRN